jgi:hypothetical protein
MSGEHNPWRCGLSVFAAYNAAEAVLFNERDISEMLFDNLADLLLIT